MKTNIFILAKILGYTNRLFLIIVIFCVFILKGNISYSQNIILNPNFETSDSIKNNNYKIEKPRHWYYIGTCNYYQKKNMQGLIMKMDGIRKNRKGFQELIDHLPYVGVRLDPISKSNKKFEFEYIYTKFQHSLKKDTTYYLEFYVCLFSKHNLASNFIGAYFSNIVIDEELKQIFNNKKNPFEAHITSVEYLSYPSPWVKIAGTYKSKGNESYLYIGSFISNDSLQSEFYEQKIKAQKNLSYVYIDNVFLANLNNESIDYNTITSLKTFVLPNIFFEINSSHLLPHSHFELNKLIEHLRNNPKEKIEIFGHTDNSGTNEYNKNLSQNRAKAVANYLKEYGISEERIQYFGFGDTKPIASNNTTEGKEKNRRVEFQIYE